MKNRDIEIVESICSVVKIHVTSSSHYISYKHHPHQIYKLNFKPYTKLTAKTPVTTCCLRWALSSYQ